MKNEAVLFVNQNEMYHLIRGVRERVTAYNQRLVTGKTLNPVDVGVTLGNNEALRILGVIACHTYEIEPLSKWLYCGESYKGVEHSVV